MRLPAEKYTFTRWPHVTAQGERQRKTKNDNPWPQKMCMPLDAAIALTGLSSRELIHIATSHGHSGSPCSQELRR